MGFRFSQEQNICSWGEGKRPFFIAETPQILFVQACHLLAQTLPEAGEYSWGFLLGYKCVIATFQDGHQSCSHLLFL